MDWRLTYFPSRLYFLPRHHLRRRIRFRKSLLPGSTDARHLLFALRQQLLPLARMAENSVCPNRCCRTIPYPVPVELLKRCHFRAHARICPHYLSMVCNRRPDYLLLHFPYLESRKTYHSLGNLGTGFLARACLYVCRCGVEIRSACLADTHSACHLGMAVEATKIVQIFRHNLCSSSCRCSLRRLFYPNLSL